MRNVIVLSLLGILLSGNAFAKAFQYAFFTKNHEGGTESYLLEMPGAQPVWSVDYSNGKAVQNFLKQIGSSDKTPTVGVFNKLGADGFELVSCVSGPGDVAVEQCIFKKELP